MPIAAPKPCVHAGCGVLVRDGTSRCPKHPAPGRFADKQRGSRHERGYGSAWDKTRLRILRRDAGLCQPCLRQGITHIGNEVDHVINKAEWKRLHGSLLGVDADSNLQAINDVCHRQKTEAEAARGREARQARPTHQAGAHRGGGVEKFGEAAAGTDPVAKFSCAGVSGEGVPQTGTKGGA
jgi:5-methylcytosine-specific restriction protein A